MEVSNIIKNYISNIEMQQGGTSGKTKNGSIWLTQTLNRSNPISDKEVLAIKDTRKKLLTTNQPLRPNSDLVNGEYDIRSLTSLMEEAKRNNMSKKDMENLAAIGFQETKWGKADDNMGHVLGDWGGKNDNQDFINAYKAKMKEADRLNIQDQYKRLQVYNGLGTITPSTEKDYHGFKMKKIYGVPVPEGGISMKENPLYGKQIIDIRDNVLNKNRDFLDYMNTVYKAPTDYSPVWNELISKKQQGGVIKDNEKKFLEELAYLKLNK